MLTLDYISYIALRVDASYCVWMDWVSGAIKHKSCRKQENKGKSGVFDILYFTYKVFAREKVFKCVKVLSFAQARLLGLVLPVQKKSKK